jgi:hypothetical protein
VNIPQAIVLGFVQGITEFLFCGPIAHPLATTGTIS